jgi:glucose-1-phosphate thymidylyltransferase
MDYREQGEVGKVKGIILAGGEGTRLRPCTLAIGKQLLPVYDKPMIYYPLSTLIHAGVKEVLVVTTPHELDRFKALLGNGSQFGIEISFVIQPKPGGIPQGITLAEDFLESEPFWFILGDNLFHGPDFGAKLKNCTTTQGARAFAYRVKDPSAYGVAVFGSENEVVVDLVEKPPAQISPWAIPGIYYFSNSAVQFCRTLTPSRRGELEILDLLRIYLREESLEVEKVSRGNAWFDLGTADNLLKASIFVEAIQNRQGLLVGSPEEASFSARNIQREELTNILSKSPSSDYIKQVMATLGQYHTIN